MTRSQIDNQLEQLRLEWKTANPERRMEIEDEAAKLKEERKVTKPTLEEMQAILKKKAEEAKKYKNPLISLQEQINDQR